MRCGRALLTDLLVVQVLEGEPVTEGQLQHLSLRWKKEQVNVKCTSQFYSSDKDWWTTWQDLSSEEWECRMGNSM